MPISIVAFVVGISVHSVECADELEWRAVLERQVDREHAIRVSSVLWRNRAIPEHVTVRFWATQSLDVLDHTTTYGSMVQRQHAIVIWHVDGLCVVLEQHVDHAARRSTNCGGYV